MLCFASNFNLFFDRQITANKTYTLWLHVWNKKNLCALVSNHVFFTARSRVRKNYSYVDKKETLAGNHLSAIRSIVSLMCHIIDLKWEKDLSDLHSSRVITCIVTFSRCLLFASHFPARANKLKFHSIQFKQRRFSNLFTGFNHDCSSCVQ